MEHEKYGWYTTANLHNFEMNYQGEGSNFDGLLATTRNEDVQTLTREKVQDHAFGIGRYGVVAYSRQTTFEPLTYVGIPGFLTGDGYKLAVIGSPVVTPEMKGQDWEFKTFRKLVQYTSKPTVQRELGHNGYVAKVNQPHKNILSRLGFVVVDEVNGQYTLMAPLVQ